MGLALIVMESTPTNFVTPLGHIFDEWAVADGVRTRLGGDALNRDHQGFKWYDSSSHLIMHTFGPSWNEECFL